MKHAPLSLALAAALAAPLSLAHAQAPAAPADAPSTAAPEPALASVPTSAATALDQAAAAYEYGDIDQVIAAARPVADGAFPEATRDERAMALRLLGVGLYLKGRTEGAESAFLQLLRLRPKTRLDRATTRPEVVAFFEEVRRQHRKEKNYALVFVPPFGQFQNGDRGRGWAMLGIGATAGVTSVVTGLLLRSWKLDGPGNEFPRERAPEARAIKAVNNVSVALLAATYVAGVVDAAVRFDAEGEPEGRLQLSLFPGGAALGLRF